MNKFWIYLKTKQFRNTILMAVGTVLFVFLLAFFSLGIYTRHGSGIQVPQLQTLPIDKAIALLKAQNLEYKIDSVYVPDEKPGSVVQQDPDPGTMVKENRTIYLTVVTRIAPNVALPDLEPYTYREALATLSNYGLKVGDTTYKPDIAKDRILEAHYNGQVIKPGSKVPKGSKIDLVLGNGEGASMVNVPNLINLDIDAAKFAILGAKLTLGTIVYNGPVTDSSTLKVIAQSPNMVDSAKVNIGTRINITVTQSQK